MSLFLKNFVSQKVVPILQESHFSSFDSIISIDDSKDDEISVCIRHQEQRGRFSISYPENDEIQLDFIFGQNNSIFLNSFITLSHVEKIIPLVSNEFSFVHKISILFEHSIGHSLGTSLSNKCSTVINKSFPRSNYKIEKLGCGLYQSKKKELHPFDFAAKTST